VLLLVGVVLAALACWLVPPSGQRPPSAAESEVDDRPWDGVTGSLQVTEIWLPEPLFSLSKRETWSLREQRYQQLREISKSENNRDLFYALTTHSRQTNGEVKSSQSIEYPFRERGRLQELVEVLAAAAGDPPKYGPIDYSTAVIHVVPAGMPSQELIEQMKTSSPSPDYALPSR
jgi:hypothetical protein